MERTVKMYDYLPLDTQRHIFAYLDGLYPGGHLRQAKVNGLRELQSVAGKELSALIPFVLDRALSGRL